MGDSKRDALIKRLSELAKLVTTPPPLPVALTADRRKVPNAAGFPRVSTAPAPIEPLRSSGHFKPRTLPAPINWPHWVLLRDCEVKLREAVALSVKVNPDAVENWDKAGTPYANRFHVAIAHAKSGKLPLVAYYPLNEPVSLVVLSQFAAWAVGLNLDVPRELAKLAATVAQAAPDGVEPAQAPAHSPVTPAPVVAVVALGESDKAAPIDRGWVMKKAALIKKYAAQWPTAKRDFQDASENGLSKAAKAPGHGHWFEAAVLNWAEQRGKLTKEKQQDPTNSVFNLAGRKHTIEG